MVYEVIYTKEKNNKFENYVKNVFKLDLENDCFLYFYLGENDLTIKEALEFTENLEKTFNVNINWIDLSFIFKNLKGYQELTFSEEDISRVIYYYKAMFINSAEQFSKKGK